MSDGPEDSVKPTSRAPRIPDEVWEAHRPTIEKCYTQQGCSKKIVIDVLSRIGFIVTEKQLKHRLEKWSTIKKIRDEDMRIIVAIKRKRNEEGKTTALTYYGHIVDEKKVQRACKRFKSSDSLPTNIPPYIGFSSPKPSDEIPVLHQPIAQNSAIENYLLSSQGYFPSSLRGSQIWNTSLNGPFTFTADQLVVSRGPNEAALETPQFQNDQIETSWNSGLPRINQNEVMLYVPSPGTVTSPSSHAFGETCVVDSLAENSFAWIDQSQTLSTPTWAEPSSTSALWMTLPSPVPNSTIASRVATPTALRYQHSQAGGHQISSTQDIDQMCLSTRIRFYGTNPETAISSVHMIRTLLGRIQDNDFRNAHVFAHGTSAKTLLQELGSQALFSDVANVAGCIYQASADMIQPQTAAHHVLRTNIQMISPEDYDGHEQMSRVPGGDELNDADSARLESKMTSYCDFWITGGFLQIQMRRTQRGAPADAHNTLYSIAILAIPKVRTRTAGGILVTFARRTQDLPIYPIIRTFNVVPRDSEIIIYTERNNLEGVRRLIEEKKASPRDVDPWGVSLLGVNSSSC